MLVLASWLGAEQSVPMHSPLKQTGWTVNRLDRFYFCKTKKPRDKQEKNRESDIWKVRIEPGEIELQGLRTYIRGEKG